MKLKEASGEHRLLWADVTKAFAILLVILGHISIKNQDVRFVIYSFHIAIFFFISGFFSKVGNLSFKEYLIKNIKQLLVPVWFFGIIGMPCNFISIYIHPELYGYPSLVDLMWKPFVGLLLGTDTHTSFSMFLNGALWFVVALFVIKFFFFFNEKIIELRKKVFIGASLSIGLFYCLKIVSHHLPLVPFSLVPACLGYPVFLIGYLFRHKKWVDELLSINLCNKVIICVILLLIVWHLALWNGPVGYDETNTGRCLFVFYITGIIGTVSVIMMSSLFTGLRFFVLIGEFSIIVLGLHSYTLTISRYVLNRMFHVAYSNYDMMTAFCIMMLSAILLLPTICFLNHHCPKMIGRWK